MLRNKKKTLRKIMSDKITAQKCAAFFVGKSRDYNLFVVQVYADEKL